LFIGSYDGNLYCLSVKDGKVLWKFTTSSYVHATPAIAGGLVYIAGCDEIFRGLRIADGKEMFQFDSGGYTGASPAMLGQWAYFGTFNNDVVGADLSRKRIAWRYENPGAAIPVLLFGGRGGRPRGGGRARQGGALPQRQDRQGDLDVRHPRARGFVAGHRGRPRLRGVQRRTVLCAGPCHGKKVWEFEAGAPLSASPAIAGGRIVIGSQDGKLYCFGA
jgi:outer membrane protein assembly factor BamB